MNSFESVVSFPTVRYEVLTLTGSISGKEAQTRDAVYLRIHGSQGDCEETILRSNHLPET